MLLYKWGQTLSSGVQQQDKGQGHKWNQRKFQLNPRNNLFPLRVSEPWPRLPREAVESPSRERFKPCLEPLLCSLLWVTLLGQGVGLGVLQRALPTLSMLGICGSVSLIHLLASQV